ncbi:hypothetical protein OROMI_017103 [Orobanche minor]
MDEGALSTRILEYMSSGRISAGRNLRRCNIPVNHGGVTSKCCCWMFHRGPKEESALLLDLDKWLPADGFKGLNSRLKISMLHGSSDRFPSSQTCFFLLLLPAYPDKDMMRARLQMLVREDVAFSFGRV